MRLAKSKLLEDSIKLLVEHFGVEQVQSALARVSTARSAEVTKKRKTNPIPSPQTIETLLAEIRVLDVNRFELLSDFDTRLKEGAVLPEAEDLRQFAQVIGIKELRGRSRRDLIRPTMLFLMAVEIARLRDMLSKAEGISEGTRRKGFSLLVDNLLKEG